MASPCQRLGSTPGNGADPAIQGELPGSSTVASSTSGSTRIQIARPEASIQPGSVGVRGGYYIQRASPHEYEYSARVPVLVSDDIITGSLTEAGRMSPVRRFFCLLVTFDVLFTSLLWVITVIVTGRDLEKALHQQVLEYTIHSSMFDCVLCALLRFIVCIIFYAIFNLHHWWPVALTTAGTSAFLLAKVFLYQWNQIGLITFDVSLILLSFILAWGELWFLDFRVLPLESKANDVLISSQRSLNNERAPLLPPHRSEMIQRYMETAETASITGSNFYSLAHTPLHSDDEDEYPDNKFGYKKSDYKILAKDVVQTSWKILTKSTDWKYESESKTTGDKIETKIVDGRKIFKLTSTLEIPARILLEELFYKFQGSPNWNSLVTECKTIQELDSNSDIVYQVCASGGGGAVSTRDFVYIRHWELIDGVYVTAHKSVAHPSMPPQPNRVRGESGPCCFTLKQSSTVPNKCAFQWLLNTDLKISLPRFVLDKAIMSSQYDFMNHLRRRISVLKNELNLELV